MPQALPVVASWAAAAWSSAVTATAVGLTKIGVMAAIGEGATIALAGAAVKTGAMVGLSVAAAALMRPNTPSSGTTLDFKPDPKAPVRGAMGYTALGGNKVFQATWGYKKVAMSLGVALSLGPIDQVPRFEADGSTVSFTGQQNEATGFYAADMWQRTTLGLPGDAALLPPTGLKYGNPGLAGWGTQHAAPQVAFSFWTMVLAKNPEDRDVFTNGVPDPRWIGRWMKVWQPRYDSTYPGGNGPQRRDDWRTWGWSENPYDHALAWVRGHYKLNIDGSIDRSKRIAGVGAPDSAIDIPAFVEGANIADANGWTISGEWSTGDGKFQTLLAMLQAGGGEPISRGAQISVMVNAPRVATYTYTRDDLIGQAEIRPLTPRRERKNTIIPRYKSEAHGWQYVPAGEVTSGVYRDEDRGESRSLEVEYTHVRSAKQAGQLAAYDLANLREGLTATLPSKVHLMHIHPGACIKVDVPELALAGQKFIVRRATTNHQSASVALEVRSESDAKHPWALGQAAQPAPSPSLSAVDPKYMPPPVPDDWTAVPKPPSEGGVSQPIIIIELPIETTDIAAVIIKHGPSAAGPWTDGYEGSPRTDGRYEVAGLTPGQTYCFSLQYIAKNGAISEPDIKCGIVAGDLIAGDTTHLNGFPVQDILDQLTDVETLTAANAAAVADMGDRVDGVIAQAEDILAGAEGAAALAVLKAGEAGEAADASNIAASIATTKADDAGTAAQAANAAKLDAQAASDVADQKAQASVLAAAQAEAFAGDAGDWARASEGAAVRAEAQAAQGLTYLNQTVDARDGAVAASIASGTNAATAQSARDGAADARNAAQAAAATSVTQSAIASASASEAKLAANLAAQVGGGSMNANPTFADWPSAFPAGWNNTNAANTTYTKVAGLNGMPNALKAKATANTADFGFTIVGAATGGEWVAYEADFTLEAGGLNATGITFTKSINADGSGNAGNINVAFREQSSGGAVIGDGVVGQTYRVRGLIDARGAGVKAYNGRVRHYITSFGTPRGLPTLTWHKVLFRPATPEEVAAGTVLPGVEAQLAVTAAVAADTADRVGSVRFDVAGGTGGAAFQVSLRAGPNGSMARIVASEVCLSNVVNGQVIPALVLRDGNAELAGNLRVRGDALIDGTVNGQKLEPNSVTPLKAFYQAGVFPVSPGGDTVAEVVITTKGGPVMVTFNALYQLRHEPSGSFHVRTIMFRTPSPHGSGEEILSDEYLFGPGNTADNICGKYPIMVVDNPPAGTWRYAVNVRVSASNMTQQDVSNRYIGAMELRSNS